MLPLFDDKLRFRVLKILVVVIVFALFARLFLWLVIKDNLLCRFINISPIRPIGPIRLIFFIGENLNF